MKKNIFEKFVDLINGKRVEDNNSANQNQADAEKDDHSDKKAGDSIAENDKLLRSIMSALKNVYEGQPAKFDNRTLFLWIQDNLRYNQIIDCDFKESLITTLYDELGYTFADIEIKTGNLPSTKSLTEIEPEIFLEIEKKTVKTQAQKAVISIFNNCGSLLQDKYELNTDIPSTYNIGRGLHPQMNDNSYRENHIAIDDSPASPHYEQNKYVSRAHAHIVSSGRDGFLLYVEIGGTRFSQNRTYIYRGNEKIELDNTVIPEPLQDGDCITLSKSVKLLFKELEK